MKRIFRSRLLPLVVRGSGRGLFRAINNPRLLGFWNRRLSTRLKVGYLSTEVGLLSIFMLDVESSIAKPCAIIKMEKIERATVNRQ